MKNTLPQYVLIVGRIALLSPAICFAISVIRVYAISLSMRIICWLIFTGAITEIIAMYFAIKYRNNHIVYSVNYFVELILICLYFNLHIPMLRKYSAGTLMIFSITVIAWYNAFFIEPDIPLKLNFAMFASIVIISLSFLSLHNIIVRENDEKYMCNPDFWIAVIFMIYYSSAFTYLGLFNVMLKSKDRQVNIVLSITHSFIVILYYLALDILFLKTPALLRNYEK